MSKKTITETLADAGRALANVSPSPNLDAEVLLAHVLETSRSHLRAWPEKTLEPAQAAAYEEAVERRKSGEPVAYITGFREFWSMPLEVNPDTLIPRPDTELLVERALERIPYDRECAVLDLGTGSGAVALAIATERPRARIVATDLSETTLTVAQRNADRHGLVNVEFRAGSWFEALGDDGFDVIVSNPPYIPESDPHLDRGDLPAEPRAALAAGVDGLDAIRIIVAEAAAWLAPAGVLLIEHGYDQGEAVTELLEKHGFADCICYRDAAGHDRVAEGRKT